MVMRKIKKIRRFSNTLVDSMLVDSSIVIGVEFSLLLVVERRLKNDRNGCR